MAAINEIEQLKNKLVQNQAKIAEQSIEIDGIAEQDGVEMKNFALYNKNKKALALLFQRTELYASDIHSMKELPIVSENLHGVIDDMESKKIISRQKDEYEDIIELTQLGRVLRQYWEIDNKG